MDVLWKKDNNNIKKDWAYAVQLNISKVQFKRMGTLHLSYSLGDGYSRSLN